MFNSASTKLITSSLFLLAIVSTTAQAEFYDSRAGMWEFYLAPSVTNSKVLQFENGAEADINKETSFGFGVGYNMNSHIELSLEFSAGSANYTSTATPEDTTDPILSSSHSANSSSIDFGFTYNLLSKPFTPYITANIGSTYIDSGIYNGDVGDSCYWYPYYGYVCGPVAQTYTASEFNYGAALGLRYDFKGQLYIKGDVGRNYVDVGSSNTPDFTTYRFIFGYMFE